MSVKAGWHKCYAYLSGDHPTLPLAELRGILEAEDVPYRISAVFEQLAIYESPGPPRGVAERGGMVKEAGVVLGVTEADPDSIVEWGRSADWSSVECPFMVKPRFIAGFGSDRIDAQQLASRLGSLISRATGCSVSLRRPRSVVKVFVTEGVAVIGIPTSRSPGGFHARRPRARPFFRPGALSPQLSRVFVNLARTRRGGRYLDPFCGTGGFALEAALIGARTLCCDIDRVMTWGARRNLEWAGLLETCSVFQCDSARIPVRPGSIDAVGTDPPYGRSTSTARRSVVEVLEGFLSSIAEALARDRFTAFAMPLGTASPEDLLKQSGLRLVEKHYMRVHRSLTRLLVVAVRP